MIRPTMPECCSTCEHKAVDTEMFFDTGRMTERVYCQCDKERMFETFRDEVLTVCEKYEPSWGCQQEYRRRCGLPELPSELYPYGGETRSQRSRLREAYAEVEHENRRRRESQRTEGLTLDNAGTVGISHERQMQIWRGDLDAGEAAKEE